MSNNRPTLTGTTYALAVIIDRHEDVPTLARQIQAVYDDPSRAPDGVFRIVNVENGTAIMFLRDVGADQEVIGDDLSVANTARQLTKEFSPAPEDAPVITDLHNALLARAEAGVTPSTEAHDGWDLFEVDMAGMARIQKDDESDRFADDLAAIGYVEEQANLGSLPHLEALAIHQTSLHAA